MCQKFNSAEQSLCWGLQIKDPVKETHPVHQLSNHPVPDFGLSVSGSVFPIPHYFQLIFEAAVFRDLRSQIDTVTLVALVVDEKVGVLFQHHIRSFLKEGDKKGKTLFSTRGLDYNL